MQNPEAFGNSAAEKENEVLEAATEANERVEECTHDFEPTGGLEWDAARLKRDLKLQNKLPHKTEAETRQFYGNILWVRCEEMVQEGYDQQKIAVVRKIAQEFLPDHDLRKLEIEEEPEPEERMAA